MIPSLNISQPVGCVDSRATPVNQKHADNDAVPTFVRSQGRAVGIFKSWVSAGKGRFSPDQGLMLDKAARTLVAQEPIMRQTQHPNGGAFEFASGLGSAHHAVYEHDEQNITKLAVRDREGNTLVEIDARDLSDKFREEPKLTELIAPKGSNSAASAVIAPMLSLLVPAHSAQKCIPLLVECLLEQCSGLTPIQIVVSSDDGFDYSSILPDDPRVIYATPGLHTGPAASRNRALACATGSHVCMMDADDSVSDLFLATLFKSLERHKAFVVRSVYVKDRAVVRAFLERTLTLENYVDFYGSVLVVAPRIGFPPFQNVLAEDGLATLAVMHSCGGSLPVINAEYRITLHPDSFCALNGHTFTQRYRENLAQVESIAQAFGDVSLTAIFQRLYETRLAMSVRFDSYLSAGGSMDYHEFVLEQPDFTDHAYV